MTTTFPPTAHTNDPEASHLASAIVANSTNTERIRAALLLLLMEDPRPAFRLEQAYYELRYMNGWPSVTDVYSLRRRLSELRIAGLIVPVMDGDDEVRETSPTSGKSQTVWRVA
ncbi:hypothetical protein [Herbiconiux sp. YIM B11900]|uniref:hypothetical protein n=1 Tax=Herbiconiux sp. YIM B11900 TaxID=3404131 RepID=UPI003F854FFB